MLKYLICLLALAATACNPEPTTFQIRDGGEPEPQPEPEAPIVDLDVIDMAPPMDMAVVDMPDLAVPDEPPTREETIVLTNRDDGYIGWVSGGRLFSARLQQDAEAVDSVTDVGDASSLEGRLRGYRLTGSRPYVVLPSGEEGMLQAVDLTGRRDPVDLGLYPPFDLYVDGDVLLVGQTTPAEGASTGWRTVGIGNELGDVYVDETGFPLARSAAQAMGGWVLGFDGEACLDMTRSAVVEAPWFCQGTPGARLVGDGGERLSFVGPTVEGIRMWQAMPSVSVPPEGAADPSLRVDLTAGAIIDWFPQPTLGQLVHISEDGGAEALWWIRATQTQRAEITAPETILGLSVIKSDIRIIRWDEATGRPVPDAVEFAAGPTPPTFDPPMSCNAYAAEQCGDDDLDCNGVPEGGLCCRDVSDRRISARLPQGEGPEPTWFAGVADVGILLLMVVEGEARLLNHPHDNANGEEATEVAIWENVVRLHHFANRVTRVVASADVLDIDNPADEGEPANTLPGLLWFSADQGATSSGTPCADLRALEILDAAGTTRAWCADGAVDLPFGQGAGDAVAYPPETGTVHWIEPHALGQAGLYLVAHGEAYTLSLWSLDEGLTPMIAEEALPMAVTLLTAEERMVPIRLPVIAGGPVARVFEGALELLEPGMGWRRMPSSRWPVQADISRYEPVALSVGYTEDPAESDDPEFARVGYFLHSLQPNTQHWGQRYSSRGPDIQLFTHHGARFGEYPVGARLDPIFVFAAGNIAGGNGNVGIDATLVPCSP